MRVKKERWGTVPLLHVAPEDRFTEKLPTVIFYHGFTSAKEHNLHYAFQLAEKGIRTILPDAILHGERDEALDQVQLSLRFWEIVLTSIEELGYIRQYLTDHNLSTAEIGVSGTSMGGITTLGALKKYSWIRSAAVMMGAANYVQLAKAQMAQFETKGFKLPITDEERKMMLKSLERFDLTKNRHALNGRPIFFWHGELDPTVPFEPTFNFFKSIEADYEPYPERLRFMRDRQAAHAVTRAGILAATDWLHQTLTVKAH